MPWTSVTFVRLPRVRKRGGQGNYTYSPRVAALTPAIMPRA